MIVSSKIIASNFNVRDSATPSNCLANQLAKYSQFQQQITVNSFNSEDVARIRSNFNKRHIMVKEQLFAFRIVTGYLQV